MVKSLTIYVGKEEDNDNNNDSNRDNNNDNDDNMPSYITPNGSINDLLID